MIKKATVAKYFLWLSILLTSIILVGSYGLKHFIDTKIDSIPNRIKPYLSKDVSVWVTNKKSDLFHFGGEIVLKSNELENQISIYYQVKYDIPTLFKEGLSLTAKSYVINSFMHKKTEFASINVNLVDPFNLRATINTSTLNSNNEDYGFIFNKIIPSGLNLSVGKAVINYEGSYLNSQPIVKYNIESVSLSGIYSSKFRNLTVTGINGDIEFNNGLSNKGVISNLKFEKISTNEPRILFDNSSIKLNFQIENDIIKVKSNIESNGSFGEYSSPFSFKLNTALNGFNKNNLLKVFKLTYQGFKDRNISEKNANELFVDISDIFKNGFDVDIVNFTFKTSDENIKSSFRYLNHKISPYNIVGSADINFNLNYEGTKKPEVFSMLVNDFGIPPVYFENKNEINLDAKFKNKELLINDKKNVSPILSEMMIEFMSLLDTEFGFVKNIKMLNSADKPKEEVINKYKIISYDPSKPIDQQLVTKKY